MSDASADVLPANAAVSSSSPLRLRRGWLAGCSEQNHLTCFHRDRFPECCHNGGRIWFLSERETFLAAFFDLDTAKRIRDAANRCADFLSVNALCARVCEEHPSSIEVGLFHGEDFVHLFELEPAPALDLLMSLLESLETVMKDPATADCFAQLDHPLFGSLPSQSLKHLRASEATVTMHPMLHEVRALAPLSLTLEMLLRDQCFGGTPKSFMTQLLIDLRHFCDAYQLDLGALDRVAHDRYLEERSGAPTRPLRSVPGMPLRALRVPSGLWRDISEQQDRSVLLMTVLIRGIPHHLKAIQVEKRNTVQSAVDPTAEKELGDVHALCGASGPFQTVRLDGREYVMTLTPHSR